MGHEASVLILDNTVVDLMNHFTFLKLMRRISDAEKQGQPAEVTWVTRCENEFRYFTLTVRFMPLSHGLSFFLLSSIESK